MRALFAVIIALNLLPAPTHVDIPARLIFVQVDGESFDPAMVTNAQQSTQAAIDWWHDLSPVPTTITISETLVISTSANVFTDLDWLVPYLQDDGPFTIWVLDNATTSRYLWGDAGGTASSAYGGFVVVTYRAVASLDARITHELGHALYRLPDQHPPSLDIMYSPGPAYAARIVGCPSLALLGTPCRRTLIPMAMR